MGKNSKTAGFTAQSSPPRKHRHASVGRGNGTASGCKVKRGHSKALMQDILIYPS